jgi:hypothetical protein
MAKRDEVEGQGLIVLEAKELPETFEATDRLEAAGGQILHRYGSRVLVGDVPTRATRGIAARAGIKAYTAAVPETPKKLTETEQLGVEAWNLRVTRKFASAKASRPHEGVRWDAAEQTGPVPPDGPGMAHVEEEPLARSVFGLAEDTSPYLIGSVALGLVIVEGPTADLQFSEAERTKVVAEVQEGLTWLGRQEPKASVTFAYDINTVRVNVAPNPALTGYEPLESLWRNPALAKLGHPASFAGVHSYANGIRRNLGTRWTYVAFFTKYPTNHFAYASKPRLVMQYSNDGWGPDNIDRVFTHETGHIFGCPDEYAASNCTCDAKFGYLRAPNGNCERCAPGGFVECLMAANTWAMCKHTPVHLGWRDTDGDGALDPVDPVGNPNPFIDFSRICRTLPFICQLFGLGGAAAAGAVEGGVRTGVTGLPVQAPPESVPITLLRRILTDEEMARVDAALEAEELAYLEAIERKLRAAADEIKRRGAERK